MSRDEYFLYFFQKQVKSFSSLGPLSDEAQEQLRQKENEIAAGLLPNSFQLTVHLQGPERITRPIQTKRHLGIAELDYATYCNLIHDQWWKLYLIFCTSSYIVGFEYAKFIRRLKVSSQVKLPLKVNEKGDYVWFNQVSIPAAFDEAGNMIAHINVYQMDRPYDVNYLLSSPFTIFGQDTRPEIGQKIQEIAQQLFYEAYINGDEQQRVHPKAVLTEGQAKVLYLYRSLALDDHQDKVTSESVAAKSRNIWPERPLSQAAVTSHTRDIRRHFAQYAEQGTPLNNENFGTFREMAAFLNSMFGKAVEL